MGTTVKWTPEKIRQGILTVVKTQELDRMPSRKEVEQFYGNCELACAVTKKIGWYKLAQELQLPIKESETYFGKRQEQLVHEELIARGHESRRMPQNFPYDLLVDDCVKIDVKASRLYRSNAGNFYSFNLEKPFCTCDLYVLRLLKEDGGVLKTLIVPSKDVPTNTQISVGENKSRYFRYEEKWDYVDEYSAFFTSVS